jgi:hypothetical protein
MPPRLCRHPGAVLAARPSKAGSGGIQGRATEAQSTGVQGAPTIADRPTPGNRLLFFEHRDVIGLFALRIGFLGSRRERHAVLGNRSAGRTYGLAGSL